MKLIYDLLATLPDGNVINVSIGLHWTAVTVTSERGTFCGLASTVVAPHGHASGPTVPLAGQMRALPALELAALARSDQPTMACVIQRVAPYLSRQAVRMNSASSVITSGVPKPLSALAPSSGVLAGPSIPCKEIARRPT